MDDLGERLVGCEVAQAQPRHGLFLHHLIPFHQTNALLQLYESLVWIFAGNLVAPFDKAADKDEWNECAFSEKIVCRILDSNGLS